MDNAASIGANHVWETLGIAILFAVLIGLGVFVLLVCLLAGRGNGAKVVRGRRATSMGTRSYYRSRDSLADYQFEFHQMPDGTYRIYIVKQPSYCGRNQSAHATHRLSDGGRHYICWEGKLYSLHEAKKVAAVWADKTQRYIKYGAGFG